MVKQIPLSQGKVALVDDEDYDWLKQWKWSYLASHGPGYTGYAMRKDYSRKPPRIIYMHRLIANPTQDEDTHHRNRDGLDNRRDNLISCSKTLHRHTQVCKRSSDNPYKGVRRYSLKKGYKYVAAIKCGPRRIGLGTFWTPEEAAYAYDQKAKEIYREVAVINGITDSILGDARVRTHKLKHEYSIRLGGLHMGHTGKGQGTYTSQYKGVSYARKCPANPWRAEIRVRYKLFFLGLHETELEAALAYDRAALLHRGEKARLNFSRKE